MTLSDYIRQGSVDPNVKQLNLQLKGLEFLKSRVTTTTHTIETFEIPEEPAWKVNKEYRQFVRTERGSAIVSSSPDALINDIQGNIAMMKSGTIKEAEWKSRQFWSKYELMYRTTYPRCGGHSVRFRLKYVDSVIRPHHRGRVFYFLSKFKGFLDRMRENVEVLDEQIAHARVMSKKKDANTLQWTKTLRDLIELRNVQLDKIKAHLLGRDETGAVREPEDYWDNNQQIEFERYFKNQLSPWTEEDLKLECEDCGLDSEDVSNHKFTHPYPQETEYLDLCGKCYGKRASKSTGDA